MSAPAATSASQLTPKPTTIPLAPEKSLPPPPPMFQSSHSGAYFSEKTLPPRPAHDRNLTDVIDPVSPIAPILPSAQPMAHSTSGKNPESFLNLDPDSPQDQFFASSVSTGGTVTRRSQSASRAEPMQQASLSGPIVKREGSDSSPPQQFYSPSTNPSNSPETFRASSQLSSGYSPKMTATSTTKTATFGPRPSLPAQWKSNGNLENVHNFPTAADHVQTSSESASSAPPNIGVDFSYFTGALPDPASFPLPPFRRHASGSSSPGGSLLLDHASTHYSSDYSARNSMSTRGSIWTERSLTSCGTSPACPQQGLVNESAVKTETPMELEDGSGNESTEEIDESSVGLGITSDLEQGSSSRRSSFAPVMPAASPSGGARAFAGPFSHHRAPSWTRRAESGGALGMSSQPHLPSHGAEQAESFEYGRVIMNRSQSEKSPSPDFGVPVDSGVVSGAPFIPTRRNSRVRCSSDSSRFANSGHARNSPSISSIASCSGRMTPAFASAPNSNSSPSDKAIAVDMQCSPRSSSLRARRSPSGSPSSQLGSSKKGPKPNMDRISTIRDLSRTIQAIQSSDLPASKTDLTSAEEAPSALSSTANRSRRVSDASVYSFLQNGEFNHIIRAYANRSRWEDGLYDFDESIETDYDESKAVKTAEEGSATIVQGSELTLAQIEAATGPNTTHLILRDTCLVGLGDMLERVLPSTTSLLVLDISGCELERLPDAIGSCIALEELDISRNPVGVLPEWMLNLRALRVLTADEIGLASLPSSLIQLQELQRLSLRKNSLAFLPSWLHRMSRLQNLFVEGNAFRGVWRDIIAPLVSEPATALRDNMRPDSVMEEEVQEVLQPVRTPSLRNLNRVDRPGVNRMRSANDLRQLLKGNQEPRPGSLLRRESDADSQSTTSPTDASGLAAGIDLLDNPTTPNEHSSDAPLTSGKWGGFLKKMGRKASSSKLASAFQEPTSPNGSRVASPQMPRRSLRSSAGVSRPASRRGSAATGARPAPVSPTKAGLMLSLAEKEHEAVQSEHVPMTPFSVADSNSPVKPVYLKPKMTDLEAKKAKRRSFLPVQAFAMAGIASADKNGLSAKEEVQELDEESLAKHKSRLRALMHYLRDLDDLTASRNETASAATLLRDVQVGASLSRTSSLHRADSSNPSTKSRDSGGGFATSTAASSVSDTSSSERLRLSTATCSKDDSVRRFRIVAEIISTERTYVKGLSELVDIYVKPALAPADGSNGISVIPPSEHRAVFGNVEALLQFHRNVFLPSLISVAQPVIAHDQDAASEMEPEETAEVAERVASVFSKHAAFFKMYTSYINNCDSAQNRISTWMAPSSGVNAGTLTLRSSSSQAAIHALSAFTAQQGAAALSSVHGGSMLGNNFGLDSGLTPSQKKKIKTFMKRCRTHPRHSQLNVESYLLLPVQRIPRYRLLLEDLVKSTDPSKLSDADALATALEHVTQIASNVNESKRQSEQDRKLLSWQYRIRGPIEGPLVQPHRRLLRDGSVQLRRVVKRIPGFVRANRSASVGTAREAGLRAQAARQMSTEQVLSADHLHQSCEDLPMSMILCNDIVVLCADLSKGKDPNGAVRLRSILKLTRPVEILGGVNLRLVDQNEILYLAAQSTEEAVAWKTAFDLHFYQ